jgi:hypothetical protein
VVENDPTAGADTLRLPAGFAPEPVRFPDGTFKRMKLYGFAHRRAGGRRPG